MAWSFQLHEVIVSFQLHKTLQRGSGGGHRWFDFGSCLQWPFRTILAWWCSSRCRRHADDATHALCKVFCIYRNYINSTWYLYVLSSIVLYSEMSMQLGTWPPGMTLYTSKEHMCRAALESTAFQAVDIMEAEKIAKKHEGTLNSDSFERCFDMLRCLMPHVSDQLQNHSRMRPWRTILVSGSSTWGLMVEWLWTIFWCRCRCFDYPYVTLMFECSAFWLLKAMKA